MIDQRRVLIVRVWWEHDPQLAVPVMRGSLQQLGSEQRHYFTSLKALSALLQAALPPAPANGSDDSAIAVS